MYVCYNNIIKSENKMNVTLNLITEFEDIPHEVAHMLKFVQDELSFTARRTANVSAKLNQDEVNATEALDLLHSVRLQMAKIDTRMEDWWLSALFGKPTRGTDRRPCGRGRK